MSTIRVDFCDFFPGFKKTDNFFYHLLRKRFDIEICDQPDFLIYSDPLQHVHRVHNCVKILFTPESYFPDFREYDYALTCHYLEDPRHLRFPYYAIWPPDAAILSDQEKPEAVLAGKTKFCCFIVSNANPKKTQKTNRIFQTLVSL